MTETEKQYVIFKLGQEVFGLDISKVKEIIVYQNTTKIPGSSEIIEGIINLRGRVIPIIDLRKKLNFKEDKITNGTRIVVVETQITVGIVVDSVSEVLMIAANLIEKPSTMITTNVCDNYIEGIANMEDRLVIILDLERVIDQDIEQVVQQKGSTIESAANRGVSFGKNDDIKIGKRS